MLEILDKEHVGHVSISVVTKKLKVEVQGLSFPGKTDETKIKYLTCIFYNTLTLKHS